MEKKKKVIPAYCSKCGSQLVISKKGSYFDNETGKPKHWDDWKCPNKTFFSWGHDTGHRYTGTNYIVISFDYD